MSEWKEFPKDKPDTRNEFAYYWISDGEYIRFVSTMSIYSELDDQWKYFQKVEKPELPKPKLHRCSECAQTCYEDQEPMGHKFLRLKIYNFPNADYVDFNVNFCPFCGYSPNKQKETQ